MKSSKSYITKYIILKILNGDYKIDEPICSENKLAIKFNCSRLTSRSALINLVNIGILKSIKGKGYIVSKNSIDILFFPKSLKDKSYISKFEKIEEIELENFSTDIKKMDFAIYLIKNFDSLNKLISMSFIFFNMEIIDLVFESKYMFDKKNPIEGFVDICFAPSSINNDYISSKINNYNLELKELGYKNINNIPIIDQTLFNEKNEIVIRSFNINKSKDSHYSLFLKIINNN